MLCFKVYWELTIGEDTPETSLVFMNLFYWIKYNEMKNSRFMFKTTFTCAYLFLRFPFHFLLWQQVGLNT